MRQVNPPVALVTGAAHGIGRGIAERLAGDGYAVALLDINDEACAHVASEIASRHPVDTLPLTADTGSESQVASAFARLHETFGRLDAIVNNAGNPDPSAARTEELERATWDRYLEVNLTGYFLVVKHGMRSLRETRGAIVNIASIHAVQSDSKCNAAYAATKGGIVAFTHALALEVGPEVRVNCISPGWIDTRDANARRSQPLREIDHAQHPTGRVGEPRDVAAMTAFLLSDDAGFITGQHFIVDGGMTRKLCFAE